MKVTINMTNYSWAYTFKYWTWNYLMHKILNYMTCLSPAFIESFLAFCVKPIIAFWCKREKEFVSQHQRASLQIIIYHLVFLKYVLYIPEWCSGRDVPWKLQLHKLLKNEKRGVDRVLFLEILIQIKWYFKLFLFGPKLIDLYCFGIFRDYRA